MFDLTCALENACEKIHDAEDNFKILKTSSMMGKVGIAELVLADLIDAVNNLAVVVVALEENSNGKN